MIEKVVLSKQHIYIEVMSEFSMDSNEILDLRKAILDGIYFKNKKDKKHPVKIGILITSGDQKFIDYSPTIRRIPSLLEHEIFKLYLKFDIDKSNVIKNYQQIIDGAIIQIQIEYDNIIILDKKFEILDKNGINKETAEICPLVKRLSI